MSTIKVKLVRSYAGRKETHCRVAKSLGLTKINQVREHKDTPEIRGQIKKIDYMLEIVE